MCLGYQQYQRIQESKTCRLECHFSTQSLHFELLVLIFNSLLMELRVYKDSPGLPPKTRLLLFIITSLHLLLKENFHSYQLDIALRFELVLT